MVPTDAYRTPDGRIAVPVHGRNDIWLLISSDGSTSVGLGELSTDAVALVPQADHSKAP